MRGDDRQAYDRGSNIFSPDGRLYQVEYAREAVKRGSASVGVRVEEGVVLAATRRVRSPLLEPRSVEKLHAIDEHHGVASAGHVADARQLVDVARRSAQIERLRYGQPIATEELTTEVSRHIQEYTQSGGARPFGAALLVGGFVEGEARLFETDPSGTPYEWRATAIGGGSDGIRERLKERYDPEMGLDDAVALARDVLSEEDDVEEEFIAVAVIDDDGYRAVDGAAGADSDAE
ncbi:archaeal proteasome endopeptidase complex subunit alpha [Halomarina halobia]|uniref:Proteasome subunit alpha n=1 Tax=Halomarina halobia TaxID=3033386 RepID=A0ABD6A9Y0_9EURY|nr:archaeal proteasome endopeptidase complex subunit alpha [Halomarina sp. PSR21]